MTDVHHMLLYMDMNYEYMYMCMSIIIIIIIIIIINFRTFLVVFQPRPLSLLSEL